MVEDRDSNLTLLIPVSSIPTATSDPSIMTPTGFSPSTRGAPTHLPLSRVHLSENAPQITYSPIQSETSSCLTDYDPHPAQRQGNELGLPQSRTGQWLLSQKTFFRNHAQTYINSRGKAETEIY